MVELETRKRTARPKTRQELSSLYPLSIVIPTRNSSTELDRCLGALARNDLTHTEIFVVDDASTEPTTLPGSAGENEVSPRLISLPGRRGPAGARNAGLRECRHPHVLFLDSDIVLPDKSIEWIRESLHLYEHRSEVAGVLGLYADETPFGDFLTDYKNLYTRHLYLRTDPLSPYIHTPIFCVQRALLNAVGGFNTGVLTGEDFQLGVTLGRKGYRFVIDRRISGVHLKSYTLRQLLRENRQRIQDLVSLQWEPKERAFALRAQRWSRIFSLLLPGPCLLLLLVAPFYPPSFLLALLLLLFFVLANLSFLRFCRRLRGLLFTLRAAATLFFEMLTAEYLTLRALLARTGRKPTSETGL